MSDAPIGGLRDGCVRPLLWGLLVAVLFAGFLVLIDAMPPAPAGPTREQVEP